MADKTRISVIDAVRGFALFGVLLVNLTMMNKPLFSNDAGIPLGTFDWGLRLFAEGKFYTIFSILFGLGFYLFIQRRPSIPLFRRRLLGLLLFGFLHLIFVWYGDILHVYALAGLILVGSAEDRKETLLKKSIFFFVLATVLFSGFSYLSYMTGTIEDSSVAFAYEAYTSTSYLGMLHYRVTQEVPATLINTILVMPKILSLFYLGYFFGKIEIFQNDSKQLMYFKKILGYGLLVFIVSMTGMWFFGHLEHAVGAGFETLFEELSTLSGGLFYMAMIRLSFVHPSFSKILSPLCAIGRMSLTNYLTQTIFWTTVFNGYGLGRFGNLPDSFYLPGALLFFCFQGVLSVFWLKRFKFGPFERLWRRMTYGR